MRRQNFIICGLIGWCMEVFFTAITTPNKNKRKLTGHSSIWMFPIYGLASFIGEVYPRISKWPRLIRASFYGFCIMTVEYLSGSILKRIDCCPWCYDGCKYSINGLIRLDYFPFWMGAGMLYEYILRRFFTKREFFNN